MAAVNAATPPAPSATRRGPARRGAGRREAPLARLVRPADRPAAALVPDRAQQAAVDHPGGPLLVLAGPGTGKTATVVELVAARVAAGLDPEAALVLTFSRRAAAELRDRLAARLGRTTTEPLARTFHSYAFGLLRRDAVARGDREPRLRPAADAELALRELLAGRRADGAGSPGAGRPVVDWPAALERASRTEGFAAELHDLLARAGERGLDPAGLARLADAAGRPDWAAAADVMAEYEEVSGLSGVVWAEAPTLVREAVELLRADPALLARERAARRLVVVDEVQDCDPAQVELLELVAGGGGDLVAVGDPDQAIYAFRGTDRSVLDAFPDRFATPTGPAPVRALRVSRRAAGDLLAATRRLAAGVPAGRTGHRDLVPAAGVADGTCEVVVRSTATAERDWLTGRLRALALREGRSWSQMAVVVRTGAELGPVRRALRAAAIPVTAASDPTPVALRPAARDLLGLADLALAAGRPGTAGVRRGRRAGEVPVVELFAGPFGGLDAVAVRRLRVSLAQPVDVGPVDLGPVDLGPDGVATDGTTSDGVEPDGVDDDVAARDVAARDVAARDAAPDAVSDGGPPGGSGAVLDAAFADPGGSEARRVAEADRHAGRLLEVVAAGAAAAAHPGAGPADVLWALWDASGASGAWTRRALAGGPSGALADRWLDAVVALVEAAERYAEEYPAAGTGDFLAAVTGRALPEATERPATTAASGRGSVAVLTAHASKGLQWPVVAVVGVQERVWPDLRARADLLGQRDLLTQLDGPAPVGAAPGPGRVADREAVTRTRAAALAEERRLFYVACTRASARLLVSAVADGDQRPSRFLTELGVPVDDDTRSAPGGRGSAGATTGPVLDAGALVAELRRVVCRPGATDTELGRGAARQLARLAGAGVPGADPERWWGRAPVSDERPRLDPDVEPVLSPSRLETIATCPLRWFLTQAGARGASTRQQRTGILVHGLAEAVARGLDPDLLRGRLEAEVEALGFGPGWVDRRRRRELAEMVDRLAAWSTAQRLAGRTVRAAESEIDHREQTAAGAVRIRGRADLVDSRGEEGPRVVDFKTGRSTKTVAEAAADPQLAAYQLAVGEGGPTGGAVLVYLADGSPLPTERAQPGTDGTAGPELDEVLQLAGRVTRAARFEARPNDGCPRCPVRTSCPAQAAGGQVTA